MPLQKNRKIYHDNDPIDSKSSILSFFSRIKIVYISSLVNKICWPFKSLSLCLDVQLSLIVNSIGHGDTHCFNSTDFGGLKNSASLFIVT